MSKNVKNTTNMILAGVAMAMGIAVVVISTLDSDFSIYDSVRILGIAVAALGLFALNSISKKSENN